MKSISLVPTLNADNHKEWSRKVNLPFVCAKLELVIKKPQPVQPPKPVREEIDDDATCEEKHRNYAPLELSQSIANKKWITTNKKCMAFIENTIDPSLTSSIKGCASTTKLLERIKSQFTSSSKTYATQMLKQVVEGPISRP
jgi:hypothetical protein